MRENELQKRIHVEASKVAGIFRVPAGMYYAGKVKQTKEYGTILTDIRPVRVAVPGYSDLTGYRRSEGRFVAIEVKTASGRPTEEQLNFIEQVRKAGGCAGIARSVDEALEIIGGAT